MQLIHMQLSRVHWLGGSNRRWREKWGQMIGRLLKATRSSSEQWQSSNPAFLLSHCRFSAAAAEPSTIEDPNTSRDVAETILRSMRAPKPRKKDGKWKPRRKESMSRGGEEKVRRRSGPGDSPSKYGLGPKAPWGSSDRGGELWPRNARWMNVSSALLNGGQNWGPRECRLAWRKSVMAHVQPASHNLQASAACFSREGMRFLTHLRKTTIDVFKDKKMNSIQARDIGWAAGKQYWLDKKLGDLVVDGLMKDGDLFMSESPLAEIAPVVWALANCGQYPEKLFDKIKTKKAEILDGFNVQNSTNILWAMAVCNYYPGNDFLQWMSEYTAHLFVKAPNSPMPQAVSDLMWSLGRFGFEPEPVKVVHKVLGWAYDRLPAFKAGEIAGTAVGLAMCKALTLEDMQKLGTSFRDRMLKTMMPLKSVYVRQMFMLTLLFPPVERLSLQEMCFAKDLEQVSIAHQEQQSKIAVQMRNNHFLQRVGQHLEQTGTEFKIGALTADRNLAVELLVVEKDETYAIIPVFPTSRNRNGGTVLLGETILAKRLTESLGMKYGGVLDWSSGVPASETIVSAGTEASVEGENVESVEKTYS